MVSEVKYMVLGFMFDSFGDVVCLIEKKHPEWQAGKMNGVGGYLEGDETALDAMIREFKEETGVYWREWVMYARMRGRSEGTDGGLWQVEVFKAFTHEVYLARTTGAENIIHCPIPFSRPFPPLVGGLNYLIPLAVDKKRTNIVEIVY